MKKTTKSNTSIPFVLGRIYRLTDARKALGIGHHLMRSLHSKEKVEVRTLGGKDYVLADDIWNAMDKKPALKPTADNPYCQVNTQD